MSSPTCCVNSHSVLFDEMMLFASLVEGTSSPQRDFDGLLSSLYVPTQPTHFLSVAAASRCGTSWLLRVSSCTHRTIFSTRVRFASLPSTLIARLILYSNYNVRVLRGLEIKRTGVHIQAARKEQKIALGEYYERHGKTAAH